MYISPKQRILEETLLVGKLRHGLDRCGLSSTPIEITIPSTSTSQRHDQLQIVEENIERYLRSSKRYATLVFFWIGYAHQMVFSRSYISDQDAKEDLRLKAKLKIDFINRGIDPKELAPVLAKQLYEALLDLPINMTPSLPFHTLLSDLSQPLTIAYAYVSPRTQSGRRIGEERRDLSEILRSLTHRDALEIWDIPSCRIRDLNTSLSRMASPPHVFHYSGHGSAYGLFFEDDKGDAQLVLPESLGDLLSAYGIQTAVLNSSFAPDHAQIIADRIHYAIAMDLTIGDKAAISLSRSLYEAMGEGNDVERAFELARLAVRLEYPGCDPNLFKWA